MFKARFSKLSMTERRVFWLVLSLATLLGIFASTLLDTPLAAPGLQFWLVNAVPFFLVLLSLVGASLILFGLPDVASWSLLVGSLATLLLVVSQAEGYGFPAALALLAVTLFVPLQLLPGRKAATPLVVGLAGTVAVILVDTFWRLPRIPAVGQDLLSVRVVSILLGIIILSVVVSQYRGWSIQAKLLTLAVGTALVSILLVASFVTYSSQRALQQATRDSLVAAARHTVEQVDVFMQYSIDRVQSDARIPAMLEYLKASSQQREAGRDDMLALFNALSKSDAANIDSMSLLAADGSAILDTSAQDLGAQTMDREYFTTPLNKAVTFVSPVMNSSTPGGRVFYISAPVFDGNGRVLGVLVVRYRAAVLSQILISNNEFAGKGSHAILLDEHNIVLAHGTKPGWVSHILTMPNNSTFTELQSQNRIAKDIPLDNLSLGMPGFDRSVRNSSVLNPFFSSQDSAWETAMEVGVATSTFMPWKVVYLQPQFAAFQQIIQQRQIIILTALLTAILIAIAGFAVAGAITRPVLSLAYTAERIAAGDLSARADVATGDEIHALATSFNRMTDRLRDTLASLEHRVIERTADLELARQQSEQRARELHSISEISRLISSEQRLDTLLTLITGLVSDRFDFYHVGIFFIDSTGQYAVLQAANSEGGQRMLAGGHRLKVGQIGIVGNVAKTGQVRIALDVGTDAVFFDNPELPETRSEMALPLQVHGRTIGVLDVQSTEPAAFSPESANTLSILADQIAIAIDNARLFGQNQQALEELQALYNQYLRQEWRTFIQNRASVGYVHTVGSGKPLEAPVASEEIGQALQSGQVVVTNGNDQSLPSIALPVRLRGQTIGVLLIKAPTKNHKWNQDEIHLVQAVSDRLGLALDNARLLFVSQRQTAKEQKIGEVTAKIGASINMHNVLQTAVEELGRALPGSDVVIQFQSNGKQG